MSNTTDGSGQERNLDLGMAGENEPTAPQGEPPSKNPGALRKLDPDGYVALGALVVSLATLLFAERDFHETSRKNGEQAVAAASRDSLQMKTNRDEFDSSAARSAAQFRRAAEFNKEQIELTRQYNSMQAQVASQAAGQNKIEFDSAKSYYDSQLRIARDNIRIAASQASLEAAQLQRSIDALTVENKHSEERNILAIKPKLGFSHDATSDALIDVSHMGIFVRNCGFGPAVISCIELRYDRNPIPSCAKLTELLIRDKLEFWDDIPPAASDMNAVVLAPNEGRWLYCSRPKDLDSKKARTQAETALSRVSIKILFKDIYGRPDSAEYNESQHLVAGH